MPILSTNRVLYYDFCQLKKSHPLLADILSTLGTIRSRFISKMAEPAKQGGWPSGGIQKLNLFLGCRILASIVAPYWFNMWGQRFVQKRLKMAPHSWLKVAKITRKIDGLVNAILTAATTFFKLSIVAFPTTCQWHSLSRISHNGLRASFILGKSNLTL
jgi:hypothetical protein